MRKISDYLLMLLFFISFFACQERKNHLKIKIGDYYGEVGFHLESTNDRYWAVLESSASQEYSMDNSFDCKLLFIENTNNSSEDNLYFTIYNLTEDSVECGNAIIKVIKDTAIELLINPNDNIGMCIATIDFSRSILLNDKPNK